MLMLTGTVYDKVKQFVQIWLPAISTLYFTLGNIWGLPYVEQTMGTLAALATFLGVVLGLSSKTYYGKNDPYAGDLIMESDEDGSTFRFAFNDGPEELASKDTITFRVVTNPPPTVEAQKPA